MFPKCSISEVLSKTKYLANRTPESGFNGETSGVFARICESFDGAIYMGHYTGSSEWERHRNGDELVLVLEGATTVVLLAEAEEHRLSLGPGEFVVVPRGVWHRFDGSKLLKVMSVTPTPTDHSVGRPDA